MNILKISRLSILWFCLLAIACAEDKGNYTYEDKAVITIDSISSMLSVLANAEYIDLKPVVTSNLEGIIDERNTNFEFAYQRKNSEGEWEEVANTKDLHMLLPISISESGIRSDMPISMASLALRQRIGLGSPAKSAKDGCLFTPGNCSRNCNGEQMKAIRYTMKTALICNCRMLIVWITRMSC